MPPLEAARFERYLLTGEPMLPDDGMPRITINDRPKKLRSRRWIGDRSIAIRIPKQGRLL